ncbi:uncharacterized protein Nmag_2299 [Natrialba magadii ATCC 43099]|uniref:TFIIB-type zinc ribbon-containing protein n=1 Tax=Natrialba magadii (strain ATCC 43099 / DSM 3394 / CCM 3739 / CIP 104546 / IAM 13178 / JCM 8861 / NBRC 102185 / NCIMB 2190 / MS3) TaxID=547559 RepID=D3SWY0_NATMM|nr:hypothetical protein [Natrialba magadii]ADD05862.1 uncharacterized protein Nmag_2299 [Natrialba magadii ATCC 43099]ELY30630.1 hypothetical protein C500_08922 [Natrialba magadii ATCC 43099]
MKIRGERKCRDCGTRWSYYETGSIDCPGCGSLRSVGTDDRTEHTDLQVPFDLTPIRSDIDDTSTGDLADRARDRCREYVRQRGFVNAGDLRDLDDTYLAAIELRHVADVVTRELEYGASLDDRDELYFLSLLRDADTGERPPVDDVPPGLQAARGLAMANAVQEYRRDVRTWLEEGETGRTQEELAKSERQVLESLGEHVKRIRLLDGDIEPETADRLVEATRDLADGLRGDEVVLGRAQDRLERLEAEI